MVSKEHPSLPPSGDTEKSPQEGFSGVLLTLKHEAAALQISILHARSGATFCRLSLRVAPETVIVTAGW